MSRIINNVLITKLALAPVILIIYRIRLCLTIETLTTKLILKVIKFMVFILSIVYLSLFLFPTTVLYIITSEAEHLSFINNIQGPASRPLATLLGFTTTIVLCVFIIFIT
jgi:hypothetical protein